MAGTVRLLTAASVLWLAMSGAMLGQTPQPFPRSGAGASQPPAPASQTPSAPVAATAGSPPASTQAPPLAQQEPTPDALVFPVYPAAQFLAAYDAGRGQHYYIYGTTASFDDIVSYYRSTIDERGRLVFKEPPTYMFEVGRFREETMAFPPGVTVKDWTWGGSQGYPNPVLRGQPSRFPTIIMIVPPPPGSDER
jgi:hypothetical protein